MDLNKFIQTLLIFLSLHLFCGSGFAHKFCVPVTTEDLIQNIIIANSNNEDDIMDLGGRKFIIDMPQDATCLPAITADNASGVSHTLTIKNGTLEVDRLMPGLRCRHLKVLVQATLLLEDMVLQYGFLDTGVTPPANFGGSIYNLGSLGSNGVTFGFNEADKGGAIYNNGVLSITNTTFNTNTATEDGGAIYNNDTIDKLVNSTFFNNTASFGGAIYNSGTIDRLTNTTIARNQASTGGGGIYNFDSSPITNFISTIVAANSTAINGGQDIYDPSPSGIMVPQYNLIGTDEKNSFTNTDNNMVGTTVNPLDPMLGILKNNGGYIWTMKLISGSPAINAGSNPSGLTYDERGRGFLRTSGNITDIGAYELQICLEDSDNDEVCNDEDNCPCQYNPDQKDSDQNGEGDACDLPPQPKKSRDCVFIPIEDDSGNDDEGEQEEREEEVAVPVLVPVPMPTPPPPPPPIAVPHGDGIYDNGKTTSVIETAPKNPDDYEDLVTVTLSSDTDHDGIESHQDNCSRVYNPDQLDSDFNGVGDACEQIMTSEGVDVKETKTATPKKQRSKIGCSQADGLSLNSLVLLAMIWCVSLRRIRSKRI